VTARSHPALDALAAACGYEPRRQLRFTVPGVPSTDHRPRASARVIGGKAKIRHRRSDGYDAFKQRVRLCAQVARPEGWPLDAPLYAVQVMGYLTSNRPDADNLRGVLDACEGVLWSNDRRVRPVTYDYAVDKANPRVEVTVVRIHAGESASTTITITTGRP
jgi:Holliday junction resolvase RusA-like endonuclease